MIIALRPNAPSCRYHYDPLDRLIRLTSSTLASTQRFYLKDRLVTEIQGLEQRTIFQYDNQLLAQQQFQSTVIHTYLLVTDQQRSILYALGAQKHSSTYTPYGHRLGQSDSGSVLEFNGERRDCTTGHYLLGNGYRAYNPVLMRFNSPDSLSPFGEGGLNPYAYCQGDPVNYSDSTGHFITAFLGTLTTTASALMGVGISVAGGILARAQGLASGWVYTSAASGITSAAVIGVILRPSAPLIAQQIARPLAQTAFLAASTVAARAIAPVARNVANHLARASQRLARTAIESDLARQLMQSPPARHLAAYGRGFDLPLLPQRTSDIRSM